MAAGPNEKAHHDRRQTASGAAPARFLELLGIIGGPLRRRWTLLLGTFFGGWGKFFLPMIVPLLTASLIDDEILPRLQSPQAAAEATSILLWYGAAFAGILIFTAIFTWFRHVCSIRLVAGVQYALRRRVFHHIQRLSLSFFHRHHAGSLGSRVSSDINYAGIVVDRGVVQLGIDVPFALVVTILMMQTNWQLGVAGLVVNFLNAFVFKVYGPKIRATQRNIQEQQSMVTGKASEIFSGISLVKAFAGERRSSQRFDNESQHVQTLQRQQAALTASFNSWITVFGVLAQVVVLLFGAWLILVPKTLQPGELVSMMMLVGLVGGSIQRLTDSMMQVQDGFAALERMRNILEAVS
jgi:ABC-type multidrug transport system fused ATPase/permease subunit